MNSVHGENIYHRTFATIDLSAIDHNLNLIKSVIDSKVKIMAVVKSDAYGHGIVEVASHIRDKIDYFAVADIGEAEELRENGITEPVLVLSYTSPSLYGYIVDHNITATLYNLEEALMLNDIAMSKCKKAKIHIAVDTGMGRIGFPCDESSADAIEKISKLSNIETEGIFSHYACADHRDKSTSINQAEIFDSFIEMLNKKNIHIPIKHLSNSAGTMSLNNQYDMCRIGIAMYGLYPSDQMEKENIKLIPAMEVISHIVHIKSVPKGFKIGYGHTYEAPSQRKIATVSIGYADGFNHCLSNKGYVIINGKKAPVVGSVCMDMIMVDVTDIDDVYVGMHVIIIGENNGLTISAEEFGELTDSFNYEVICTFMPRVKRFYYIDGKLVK